ncbi:chorismate synthase [Methanoplanus sp. FWC-SCC4]|uniref:Chorismate synthase n=1 Tax=Methanochimaera problematica TaxID=2609417 RepID=A0AA97I594_9EURY|nr:chorismate synthase [Methanoplanus sp. FWC-SCC4]WOF17219.1 chorismate synthase [Methanoplanus sp. FWC-SCC4]
MNTFGRYFRCTSFGESHGKALGVVIDGCPPGIELSESDLMPFIERRRPGKSALSTPRIESDIPEILSGVFEGRTTGMPVAVLVYNRGHISGDYDSLKDLFRPGHADFTYQHRYGRRDFRGGGRSSGRETVSRVLAGGVAMKFLEKYGIFVSAEIIEIHGERDPVRFEDEILSAKAAGDSVGGIVEIRASGCPVGLGSPVFGKLDSEIASAMMSVGSVKGVEIGDGFEASKKFGSENNDEMDSSGFLSNHAGGILGGISTGEDIVVRIAVKPTPSVEKEQKTVDTAGDERVISVGGRHDPCIVPRVVVVAECMLALVLADALIGSRCLMRDCE